MLELAGEPRLDKTTLIGGCVRLPLRVDAALLRTEVEALPAALWAGTDGRVGVHNVTQSLFLRGHAPAQGNLPIEDRAPLTHLPYVQRLVRERIPGAAQRCVLARLPAGASILPHIDRAPYFAQTLRLHLPVITHDAAWMLASGLCYRMQAGEVWVLNNTAAHAVWNAHASASRTHLICDFLPSPALLALLAAGERDLGKREPDVDAHFAALARPA